MVPAHALAAELQVARPWRRPGHRRARRAHPRPVRRTCRCTSCPPGGSAAGRSAGSRPASRCSPGGARRRGSTASSGPTRWSASAAIRPSRRCWRRARWASRPSCMSRMPCSGGSTGCWPATRRRSPPLTTQVDRLKPRHQGKTVLVGNPVRAEVARLGEAPLPPFDEYRAAQNPDHRRQPGRLGARQGRAGRAGRAGAVAAPSAADRPAMPARRHRSGARPLCRARHPGRAVDLYHRHARQDRRRAPGHRPRRRLDHRRADRRRAAGDPGAAAERDRRPPDRQRPRDGEGRRRADDRAGRVYGGCLGPPDRGAGRGPAGAGQCRRPLAVGRPPERGQRPGRPRRADRRRAVGDPGRAWRREPRREAPAIGVPA